MRIALILGLLSHFLVQAPSAHAKVRVVTTIQTFRSLAEEIGGDQVEVTALVGESVDPHHVDPRPSHAVTLNKADLLVHVGLDLERGWLPPLLEQARNPKVRSGEVGNLDASTAGIMVLDAGGAVTRAQGDIHPMGNPHYWLHPDNALRVARALAERLKRIDPGQASTYEARLQAFSNRLAARRKEWEENAKALAGVKIVTYHKSWSYLTSWLKLVEIGNIEPKPGVPPDPKHLAELVGSARSQGAKMVIVETYYPRNTAQRVATLAGMKAVVLPSDAGGKERSYFALVDKIVTELVAAVR
ncbi:MAG: zinc ABC transporter substrate-binding protein [Deltaproteobacteria bacterium]|nr:zinc ABC transporter substrate-binding protein [Deltaproteobacteria bacterium]